MKKLLWILLPAAALLAVALAAIDTVVDGEPFRAGDFAFEVVDRAILLATIAGVAWAVLAVREARAEQTALREDLARAVSQGAGWRAESSAALADLGAAIERQFRAWSLTPAEADIAGLMLKGVPLRQIAALRRTSETTIRQQAQAVYRKAGLSGRAELSAYFLESLFDEAASGTATARAS